MKSSPRFPARLPGYSRLEPKPCGDQLAPVRDQSQGVETSVKSEESSAELRRRGLGRFIEDDRFLGSAEFENPTWRRVVGLFTGAATLTGIDSIGQVNIGMALATEPRNRFRFS